MSADKLSINSKSLFMFLFIFSTLAFFCFSSEASSNNDPLVVETTSGLVRGLSENGFRVWKGIPYADQSRWENPKPASSWSPTILNTTEFGPECPQAGDPQMFQSEDCLSLNIWTPPHSTNLSSLPVLVWIYGGAFFAGSTRWPVYIGDYYANSTNVVMVSINYRIGALGFMASKELGLAGNYGFMDQQFALAWVQENIANFGGDPKRVTIFGQSAGGMSVTYHVVSPTSANLFQSAIIESNPFGIFLRTMDENRPTTNSFLRLVGCDSENMNTSREIMKCLNSKNFSEIVAVQEDALDPRLSLTRTQYYLPWAPTIDGDVIPDQPLNMILNGQFNKIPITIGTTKNETTAWTFGHVVELIPLDEFDYELFIRAEFLEHADRVLDLYPPAPITFRNNDNARTILSNVLTDFLFLCPMQLATQNFYSHLSEEQMLYQYYFLHNPLTDPSNPAKLCNNFGAACHSAELTSVFNAIPVVLDQNQYTPAELQLAWSVLNYWASFATSQTMETNPLNRNDPTWPPYTIAGNQSIGLDIPIYVLNNYRQEKCDFWNSLPYFFEHGTKSK